MATCPKCHKYFNEPEDEQYDHDCPNCGHSEEETEDEE